MNVKEIVAAYLENNGFDGLFRDDCGCRCDDLMPCSDSPQDKCEAGCLVDCSDNDCDYGSEKHWHIQKEKQK